MINDKGAFELMLKVANIDESDEEYNGGNSREGLNQIDVYTGDVMGEHMSGLRDDDSTFREWGQEKDEGIEYGIHYCLESQTDYPAVLISHYFYSVVNPDGVLKFSDVQAWCLSGADMTEEGIKQQFGEPLVVQKDDIGFFFYRLSDAEDLYLQVITSEDTGKINLIDVVDQCGFSYCLYAAENG